MFFTGTYAEYGFCLHLSHLGASTGDGAQYNLHEYPQKKSNPTQKEEK